MKPDILGISASAVESLELESFFDNLFKLFGSLECPLVIGGPIPMFCGVQVAENVSPKRIFLEDPQS